jgi:hypothetical protein
MRIRGVLSGLGAPLIVALVAMAFAAPARADLLIHVDKSTQTMTVTQDGQTLYTWPVSTGVASHDTPSGDFKPFRMDKDHFSREWDDAPMPYSIFFTMQGHAIHGTNHASIGRPASHGCVRLSVAHAATLWALVKRNKMANTKVELTGRIPPAGAPVVARRDNGLSRGYSNDGQIDNNYQPNYYPPNDIPPRQYQGNQYQNNDDDVIAEAPQRPRVVRGWREYNDGQRYTYDRQRAYDPPPPPPRDRDEDSGLFGFLFGR